MLRMNSLTLENIDKMQEKRLEHLKKQLETETDENRIRVIKKKIWMIQNS